METKDYFMMVQEELHHLHQQAIEGEISDLDALIIMRKKKEEAEKVLEIVKDFEKDRIEQISLKASEYGNIYKGFEIKSINGRQLYNYKGIPQIDDINEAKKQLEDKFKNAFIGFQKGTVQTTEENGVRYWIDENGELNLFPELNIGESFLQIKKK